MSSRKARVVWGRVPSVSEEADGHTHRTMTREMNVRAAAEFACDIIYVLAGPQGATAWTEKDYVVSPERPRVEWRDSLKQNYVEVTYFKADRS